MTSCEIRAAAMWADVFEAAHGNRIRGGSTFAVFSW